jgi:hypothetical protein
MKYFILIASILFSITVLAETPSLSAPSTVVHKQSKKIEIKHLVPRSVKKQMAILYLVDDDDDDDEFDDLSIHVAYERPVPRKNSLLSREEYIRLRLANARRLAMDAYRQAWL